MSTSRRAPVAALLAVLALTGSAGAQPLTFTADLTTGQEVNPVALTYALTGLPRPVPSGFATLTLNASQTELMLVATITGIDVTGTQTADPNDDLRAAHIHAPAGLGSNAGVVWGFFGTPFHDIIGPGGGCTPAPTGVGGTCQATWNLTEGNNTTLTAQLPNLLAGLAYVNFHTNQNPAGEIRGQIQLAVVPEPATVALLGGGLLALGGFGLARRRTAA